MTCLSRDVVRVAIVLLGMLTVVALAAAPGWALPAVQQVDANPSRLELNRRTEVRVAAVVANAAEIFSGAFNLERLNPNGTVQVLGQLKDDGTKGDVTAGDGKYTVIQNFNEAQTGQVLLRVGGLLVLKSDRTKQVRVQSGVFTLTAGVALPPGSGASIPGPGGTSITVQPGTFSAEVLVGIRPVATTPDVITAPSGAMSVVSAVEVIVEPTGFAGSLGPAAIPMDISVPLPAGVTDTDFVVGEQVVIDSITGTPGLKPQFLPRALAAAAGGTISTQTSALKGIQQPGIHAILGQLGSAIVTGTVSNPAGGGAASGVVVSSDTNTFVDVTDTNGVYSLFVSGGAGGIGPFTITAFHPFQGSTGSATGTIAIHGSTINNVNITLVPLAAPPVTRDGIRNGGFERCLDPDADGHGNLTGNWSFNGAARAVTQLGPTSTGVTIVPTEGRCMVDFNTGTGAVANVGSSLKQRFIVPAGARSLMLDFNFVSEEFPEFVGTQFNDTFRALITTPSGEITFPPVEVNNSGGFTLIGDCGFPGGDDTCGQTGWRTATVDLSAHSGTGTPIEVELLFTVDDRGDNIYDTHVLVDNIRFGTVWVDEKVFQEGKATTSGMEHEVRTASDILSQAGLNVRLRNAQTIPSGRYNAALLDTNLDYVDGGVPCTGPGLDPAQRDGHRTQEEIDVLNIARSGTNTDVNLYYTRSATRTDGSQLSGYAIGPDEYCHEVNILTSSGVLLLDRRLTITSPGILAHEIGHLLISPANATSTLEHGAGSTNFMNATGTLSTAILGRDQSAIIIRLNSPLVVP